jgi:YD repeat-containing protein
VFQQAPSRNARIVGVHVYSHSGELSFQVADLELKACGISFRLLRTYGSARAGASGPMGRGWTFGPARRIARQGNDVVYDDGAGRTHRFRAAAAGFASPDGLYAVLAAEDGRYVLHQPWGDRLVFAAPEAGGRLLAVEDPHGQALRLDHREDRILVTDPLDRHIVLALQDGRVVEVRDHVGRSWAYGYDAAGCLVEVRQPAVEGHAAPPTVRYEYDDHFRLVSITDPQGQTFLRNAYDERGRIRRQVRGAGTFEMDYEAEAAAGMGAGARTRVRLENGARLEVRHDAHGHVVESTLHVTAAGLAAEDGGGAAAGTVPLTTLTAYNRHGERVRITRPAGDTTEWAYDEDNPDPRARGNLLRVTRHGRPGAVADVRSLTTVYTYEPRRQQVSSVTDPRGHTTRFAYDDRGNLAGRILPAVTVHEVAADGSGGAPKTAELRERFEHDEAGRLVRYEDARGGVVRYAYHPLAGGGGPAAGPRGFLARVERHAEGGRAVATVGFEYDAVGNVTAVVDGRGLATRYRYDAHDRLVEVTSRPPFSYVTSLRRDLNGDLVEGRFSFERHRYDRARQEAIAETTHVRQAFEYDVLGRVVRRRVAAGGREIVQSLVRGGAGEVVRDVDPSGNVVEIERDERGLPLRRRFGAGTPEEVEVVHTYSANGRLRTTTDARGRTEEYHYDAFDRYEGYTDGAGTRKRQWRDEAGNVTRIAVTGAAPSFDEEGRPRDTRTAALAESWFQFDELGRLVRADRAWRDATSGQPLGRTSFDGREGAVSQVVQYGANHLPARVWREPGHIVTLDYDGANRVRSVHEASGDAVAFEYDVQGNPVQVERLGPSVEGPRLRQVWHNQFDALDRIVRRDLGPVTRQRLTYNALGSVLEESNPTGHRALCLHDAFGRPSGRYRIATSPLGADDGRPGQVVVEGRAYDDAGRLSVLVDPSGDATRFRYDALGRLAAIVYPDGAAVRLRRDDAAGLAHVVDASGSALTHRFDRVGRRLHTTSDPAPGVRGREEWFHFDGLGRLVAAVADGVVTLRRYDSLSRLIEETQSGRVIRYTYDAAGRRTAIRYPGGREVQRRFDPRGRALDVREQERRIASYGYSGSGRPSRQDLGGRLVASFVYEAETRRLARVDYRLGREGALVDGRTYTYDARGNVVRSAVLRRGEDSGDSYAWDSLDRIVVARYGVERLSEARSAFEREVRYELGPSGLWQRKTTREGSGRVMEDVAAVPTSRGSYLSVGGRWFRHDANGNRIEEGDGAGGRTRYAYDQADRLVQVERIGTSGAILSSIQYGYDALGRQVSRRVTRDGSTRTRERVWDGTRLIEEWENGRLVTSLVHGPAGEPLELHLENDGRSDAYVYTHDGLGAVTGLVDGQGRFLDTGALDVAGRPRGDEEPVGGGPRAENPILIADRVWDADAHLSFGARSIYDPSTMRFLDGSSNAIQGQSDTRAPSGRLLHDEEDAAAIESAGWVVYVVGIAILVVAPNPFAKAFGLGMAIPGAIAIGVGKYGQGQGGGKGGQQDDSSSKGPSSSNQGSGSKDEGGHRTTQETPPEHPNRDDYHKPEKHPHVTIEELPAAKGTPNPDDGTDEGFDKDFWRKLPFADPQELLEQLRMGPKVDERGESVHFRLPETDLAGFVEGWRTPQLVTVDEGGEGVTIDITGAHPENPSAGIATSDGWGDKPRTLAEAYAAPRIREGLLKSRF